MTYRLAMLDMDGTLKHEAAWLPGAQDLLTALTHAGIAVALCSGRQSASLEASAAELPQVTMLAGAGGSIAKVRDGVGWRTIGERFLAPDLVAWVDAETRRLGGELWAYATAHWLIRERTPRVEFDESFTHAQAECGEFTGRRDVIKLLMFCETAEQEHLREQIAARPGIGVASSYPGYWDIIPQASLDTKGGDLLSAELGCGWAQTLAAGDGLNDVGMLAHAQLAYLLAPRRLSELPPPDAAQERVEVANIAAAADDLRRRGVIT